jgi:hypothetical protein
MFFLGGTAGSIFATSPASPRWAWLAFRGFPHHLQTGWWQLSLTHTKKLTSA